MDAAEQQAYQAARQVVLGELQLESVEGLGGLGGTVRCARPAQAGHPSRQPVAACDPALSAARPQDTGRAGQRRAGEAEVRAGQPLPGQPGQPVRRVRRGQVGGGGEAAARLAGRTPGAAPISPHRARGAACRSEHDALAAALQQCQRECEGGEALLLALEALRVRGRLASRNPTGPAHTAGPAAGQHAPTADARPPPLPQEAAAALPEPQQQQPAAPAGAAAGTPPPPPPLAAAVLWFHHIKSLEKRKAIVSSARSLGVRGYSKPGFPGERAAPPGRLPGDLAAGSRQPACPTPPPRARPPQASSWRRAPRIAWRSLWPASARCAGRRCR
jgi:hypothetical protein